MAKQDWTPRISSVWILTFEWSDDFHLYVFLSEQAAQKAMARMMKESLSGGDYEPALTESLLGYLKSRRYADAAKAWDELFHETYSWQEYQIGRES